MSSSQDPTVAEGNVTDAPHAKSIIKILVYAPADGLVLGGSPIWEYQVHKVWSIPVATSITLAPASVMAIAGLETATLTATVFDQFDTPMEGVAVDFTFVTLEGEGLLAGDVGPLPTDEGGLANNNVSQAPGSWGVQTVVASTAGIESNTSTIQWIYQDGTGTLNGGDLVQSLLTESSTTVFFGFEPWEGLTLNVYDAPGGSSLGSGSYDDEADLTIPTPTNVWGLLERFFVAAPASTNTDEIPNWVTDVVPVPAIG